MLKTPAIVEGTPLLAVHVTKPMQGARALLGVEFRLESTIPARVSAIVAEGSVARYCGLREGDVVHEICGVAVSGASHATRLIDEAVPGSSLEFLVMRSPKDTQ